MGCHSVAWSAAASNEVDLNVVGYQVDLIPFTLFKGT